MPTVLPAGVRPLTDFCRALHNEGLPVSPDQTIAFLKSVALLGPKSIGDVYWAARAVLAPTPDRLDLFDALFDALFRDGVAAAATVLPDGPESTASESGDADLAPAETADDSESGEMAADAEALAARHFRTHAPSERLKAMRRRLTRAAPKRRGFRRRPASSGDQLDLRRSIARTLRGGSPLPVLTRRQQKHRRVLLLIDISGSMKAHTDDYLRFAHALGHALPDVETFTFGTRLTRLTRSLQHRDVARALAEAAPAVADWGGGTRIADSLAAFLAIPRFSRASRGALVIVLSDGLERGPADAMAHAVRRLAARSWRLAWLTPLAADPHFRPETAGLKAIVGIVDALGDGSGIAPLATFMESAAALGRCLPAPGRAGLTSEAGGRDGNAGGRRAPSHLEAG